MNRFFFLLVIIVAFFSCEEVVELDYRQEQKICLNGVLNPDSLVRLSLHYTRPLDANDDFIPIDDAQILLYEDGQEWNTVSSLGNGTYGIDQYPQIGKTYRVKVNIGGNLPLSAETIVPERPDIDFTIKSKEKYAGWSEYSEVTQFYVLEVDYRINDRTGKDYYWNYHLGWYVPGEKYNFSASLAYFSPYADNFNREIDAETKLGFYYHFYMRQTDDGLDGHVLEFNKQMSTRSVDVFFNADEHYDRYIKSSVQSWLIEEWEVLPFKEPVQIYSNIENGTGIFGSASFTYISYRDE
ncbi:DUF4249 domain-containing protein [Gaoshiqia sp. Z1-71]|uniref:DUF4249 domain-containing protein n=1 Tax=Gaoshiqia hydrogeniformans TaxID=3290090 RepID=UPI003BF87943